MTEHMQALRQFFIVDKHHHQARQAPCDAYALARTFAAEWLSAVDRAAERLQAVLAQEKAVLFAGERIAFVRTVPVIPELYLPEEVDALKKKHRLHELGDVNNICVDYTKLLDCGFDAKREELRRCMQTADTPALLQYFTAQIAILDAVCALTERYRQEAIRQGNAVVAESLSQVPAKPPRNFLEALQMFRILHFTMWCGRNYHNTVGRFDQYMYPYFQADLKKGVYTEETALDLLEEFFLTFNRDSDLYPGMQQGDNGQSMVLGGLREDGSDSYNLLSELCLKASLELRLIDPKINLRVHQNTPLATYELGTRLTKQGLGFPQYSNDEVVIPGLLSLGYDKNDAYNYVVAACWEFIIPGVAMDIPNIAALSLTKAVEDAALERLEDCADYQSFWMQVKRNLQTEVDALCLQTQNVLIFPAPFLSLMMEPKQRALPDISLGGKYNNYGFHGTGIATAADSLAAIKRYIFEERSVSKSTLLTALRADFAGYEPLCNKLRYDAPKMGNDNDYVDQLAVDLLQAFADTLKGKRNDRDGIFRAGTGSAMYYIWHSNEMAATPDGRHSGEGLAANYSPSLFSRCKGPVSIIKSFTKPDLKQVINGGPLTLELHDTLFRTDDSIQKVANLVRSFMDLGGHQLQLNAVNRDTMIDAQKHPEKYRNLIVRVWGWSGYFVELDKVYQDHIIQRMELSI